MLLQGIKELEADAGVGKVDNKDYAHLRQTAENRALEIIHQLKESDEQWMRQAEAFVGQRLGVDTTNTEAAASDGEPGYQSQSLAERQGRTAFPGLFDHRPVVMNGQGPELICQACQTPNEQDANFCIGCGRPRAHPAEAPISGVQGGRPMSLFLLLTVLAQPASQPASQPKTLAPGGKAEDLVGNVTWIYQVDEQVFRVQETWNLTNTSGKMVKKEELVFAMPDRTRRVNIDEDVKGFKAKEDGSAVFAVQNIGSGASEFATAHMIDFDGDHAVIRRPLPVQTVGARLIIEAIDGLEVTSNQQHTTRLRDLNGLHFNILEFAPMPAGTPTGGELFRSTLPGPLAAAGGGGGLPRASGVVGDGACWVVR